MSAYSEGLITQIGINAILAIGLYATLVSGQFSFGHAGLMAVGAYLSAVLTLAVHLFYQLADGSSIAFFAIPGVPPEPESTVPKWCRHFAMLVRDREELLAWKDRVASHGIEVMGPVDHGFCESIYFFDPNGVRLEFTRETQAFTPDDAVRANNLVQDWVARFG